MSPHDVWTVIYGYDDRQKQEWERMRELSFWIHVHSMSSKKKRSPEDFRPLPWDLDKNGKPRTAKNPKEIWEEWQRQKTEKRKNGRGNLGTD